jgi:hypothetical protein
MAVGICSRASCATAVLDAQRAFEQLREDLGRARLAVQDRGAGFGHAPQVARLLGAQRLCADLCGALVERGQQTAQLPLGARVVDALAA